jgi:hypothetical protein
MDSTWLITGLFVGLVLAQKAVVLIVAARKAR